MTDKRLKNVPASIRQRLHNVAVQTNRPFGEVLQYFAMERFLYRLNQTQYSAAFILKGALLFRVWDTPDSRATQDIDFLATMDNAPKAIAKVVGEVCQVVDEDDGLIFDVGSIRAIAIKEDADYEGVRVRFCATLERARITMQVDVGFGDIVIPEAIETEYPALLDLRTAKIRMYPPETAIAEKVEAMINLGALNSRMKDFYDVWRMSRQFNFDALVLKCAIDATFKNRETGVIAFDKLTSELLEEQDKFQSQWSGFLEKSQVEGPVEFTKVLLQIEELLAPILTSILNAEIVDETWTAPGPWQ